MKEDTSIDREIYDAASEKYFRRYSGFINEQIELDASRSLEIKAFIEGTKWMSARLWGNKP